MELVGLRGQPRYLVSVSDLERYAPVVVEKKRSCWQFCARLK